MHALPPHPAGWTGSELRRPEQRERWTHRLSTAEIDDLRTVAQELVLRGVPVASLEPAHVPVGCLEPVLSDWAHELHHGRGVVLVRGLPVGDMSTAEVEAAYLAMGVHLGVPGPQNADGDLLGHVRDDGSDPNDPTVRRYRTRLAQPFHVDGADVVGLLCLQGARSGGLSQVVSSVTVHHEVLRRRPDLEPLLHEAWCFDTYGQQPPGARPWFELPMVRGLPDSFSMFYIRWYIDKAQEHPGAPRLTAAQVELLDLIDELCQDPELHLDMDFTPGDIQFLSNRTVLHSRTAYEDDPERPRHLLRLWLGRR